MEHLNTGRKGEELAAQWLIRSGFKILHKNWRFKHWEVDIIASRNEILHFIEVKTRKSVYYGFPEEGVTLKKLRNLTAAADEYQFRYPGWQRIQFDIVSIILEKNQEPQFSLFSDIS